MAVHREIRYRLELKLVGPDLTAAMARGTYSVTVPSQSGTYQGRGKAGATGLLCRRGAGRTSL
jgi:hypothetical protein